MAKPIKYIFFDFDGTLTVTPYLPRLQGHVISDNIPNVVSLSDEEVVVCFGGAARLARLTEWLTELRAQGVASFILSHGRKDAIESLLSRAGVRGLVGSIFASDTARLSAVGNVKANLIQEFVHSKEGLGIGVGGGEAARAEAAASILFVDDTESHITIADSMRVCRTLRVASRGGLSEAELRQILAACVDHRAAAAAGAAGGGAAAAKGVHFADESRGGAGAPLVHACLIPQEGKGLKKGGGAGAPIKVNATMAGGRTIMLSSAGGAPVVVGLAPISQVAPGPPAAPPPPGQRERALRLLKRVELTRQGDEETTRVQLVPYPVPSADLLAQLSLGVGITHFPRYENGFAGLEWAGVVVGVDRETSVALLAFEPQIELEDRDAPELRRESASATKIETTTVRVLRGHVRTYPTQRAPADQLFAHRSTNVAAYQRGAHSTTAGALCVRCEHIDAQNDMIFMTRT